MNSKTRRLSLYSLFTALALILSYVESQVPFFFAVPGMKLGLTNVLVVFALEGWGYAPAFIINLARILIAGVLFGSPYSVMYSLSGGLLSYAVMALMKKSGHFSIVSISVMGGIFHNIGQIAAAALIVSDLRVAFYLPALFISGAAAGAVNGLLAKELLHRLGKVLHLDS